MPTYEEEVAIQAGAIWGNADIMLQKAILLESIAGDLRQSAFDIKAADTALKDLALIPKA